MWNIERLRVRAAFSGLTLYAAVVGAVILTGASPVPTRSAHPSGLEFVGPTDYHPNPTSEALRNAWREALVLARQNADDFGYPWPDPTTGTLVHSVVTPAAQATAQKWTPLDVGARTVPQQIRRVAASFRSLEQIKNDAVGLAKAGVPDAALIHQVGPDFERNRVIISVDQMSDPLLTALAARYGTSSIAIRVEPRLNWQRAGRDSDTPPSFGGARIITSTTQ